ncbi:efflux RND transporter permease subunit [Prosthecochloris sp. ZM_2]|uniref:efflux RND transporter permease subunit n=1 Tax=Prosthecochloris sp. ZM_2 TaxID=2045206 RepID=UPI000DF760A4|nr:efflux RND transporter permease subunit [Prosthecochloris sp. ZM_2]RNA65130.1 efflux RND transporter permease subunit [Prosthecochloris sp. ZM_2]
MRALIKYFISYPVLGNAIFLAIFLFGFLAFQGMKTTFFPDVPPDTIFVSASYPGASPEEIEEGITLKIEDKLKGVTGIDRVTSTSQENSATITVEILPGYDPNVLLQEVTNSVDQISSFPAGLERIRVYKQEQIDFVVAYAIYGDVALQQLKTYARRIERDLRNREGITKITLSGFPEEEIEVSVREDDLQAYSLTFQEVADAVANSNLKITGGTILTPEEELLIRSDNKGYYAAELENIVVRSTETGTPVLLRDVADIRDRWSDDPDRSYYNGKPAVIIDVSKTSDQDMFTVARQTAAYVEDFDTRHGDISVSLLRDGSGIVQERAAILGNNGLIGIFLVVLFLSFSLNPRMAFWVALSIPLCFAGMFLLGSFYGLTINVVSLLAMILVVGILVDDGIVIAESIYQEHEKGLKPIDAALKGTMEVLPSVVTAVLTTIIFFMIFLFLDGAFGQRFKDIAFVVIATLLISLVEGIFILPAHIAHSKAIRGKPGKKGWLMRNSEAFIHFQRDRLYAPLLRFCISNPLVAVVVPVALVFVTIGALQGGIVKMTFFPIIERDNVSVTLEMPAGTRDAVTDSLLASMEETVMKVNEEYRETYGVDSDLVTAIGRTIGPGTHQGGLRIALAGSQERMVSSMDAANLIRERIGRVPGAEKLQVGGTGLWGMPVSIALRSDNLDQLHGAKEFLEDGLNSMPELKDISDNDTPGLREVRVTLNERARALGLSESEVMSRVRYGFFGYEAQRVLRGIDEVKVWVRYDESDRSSVRDLEHMRIRLADGRAIPLGEIAGFELERGVSSVNHIDAQRVVKVEADIANAKESVPDLLERIEQEIMPSLMQQYPDVSYDFEGQSRESGKTTGSMKSILPALLGMMFLAVVFSFRSFVQAAMIFVMIPFSLVGVVWGHFIMGYILSILSLFGVVALIGIVINDSLVFVNSFNNRLKEGGAFEESVFRVGISRFRPIVLTSLTTIAGLGPLMFEQSRQAQFLTPMAISVAYGLLFGTILTLLMLPALLVLFNRLRLIVLRLATGTEPAPEAVEPAVREDFFRKESENNDCHDV